MAKDTMKAHLAYAKSMDALVSNCAFACLMMSLNF